MVHSAALRNLDVAQALQISEGKQNKSTAASTSGSVMYRLLLNWPDSTLISCIQRTLHGIISNYFMSSDHKSHLLAHFCNLSRNRKQNPVIRGEIFKRMDEKAWSLMKPYPRPKTPRLWKEHDKLQNEDTLDSRQRTKEEHIKTRLTLITPIYNVLEWTVLCRYVTVVRYVASMHHWQQFCMRHSDSCE